MNKALTMLLLLGIVLPRAVEAQVRRGTGDEPQDTQQAKPESSPELKPAAAKAAGSSRSEPWTVVGRVTDAGGQPIADVTIRAATGMGTLLGGGSTTTAADGKFALDFGPPASRSCPKGPTARRQ